MNIDQERNKSGDIFKKQHNPVSQNKLPISKEEAVAKVKEFVNSIWPESIILNGRRLAAITITPEMARLFLTSSQGNRKISNEAVQKYKRAMLEKNWVESTNMCTILNTFEFGDAHHRLLAQIDGNITLRYTAHIEATVKELGSLDSGKSRTLGALVSIISKEKVSPLITNILKYVMVYDAEKTLAVLRNGSDRGKYAVFNQYEITDMYNKYSALVREASAYSTSVKKKFPSQTAIGYVYFVLVRKFESEAVEFFERLHAGASLQKNEILYVLHEKLISLKGSSRHCLNEDVEFLVFKAWHYYHNKKKSPKTLRRGENEEVKRPY